MAIPGIHPADLVDTAVDINAAIRSCVLRMKAAILLHQRTRRTRWGVTQVIDHQSLPGLWSKQSLYHSSGKAANLAFASPRPSPCSTLGLSRCETLPAIRQTASLNRSN